MKTISLMLIVLFFIASHGLATEIVPITDLNELTTPATGDILPIVDVNDNTMSSNGTTKKITLTNFLADQVDSQSMKDDDHGDISYSGGVCTVENLQCTNCVSDAEVSNTLTIDLSSSSITGDTAYGPAGFDASGVLTTTGLVPYAELFLDSPNNITNSDKRVMFGDNRSGGTFTVTELHIKTDDSITNACYICINSLNVLTGCTSTMEVAATIDITNAGTGLYYYDQTSGFDDATIADNEWLVMEWESGTPDWLHISISGRY